MKHLKLILKIIKNRPLTFLKCYSINQIATIIPLFTGLIIRAIFSSYDNGKAEVTVWWLISFLLGVLLTRIILIRMYAEANANSRFTSSSLLRINVLNKIMEKPGAKSLKKSNGDTLNSFKEDVRQIEEFISLCFSVFLSVFVHSLLSLYVLLSINYKMTLLIFSPLIVVLIVVRVAGKRITKYRKDNRKAAGIVSSVIGEMFTNIQSIKVFGAEENMKKNFKNINLSREKYAIKDNLFSQVLETIYSNVLSIGIGMILIIVALSIKENKFNLGDFTIFTYYMNFISASIQYFGNVMTKFKQTVVAMKNLSEISEEVTENSIVEDTPLYHKKQLPLMKEAVRDHQDKFRTLKIENLTSLYPQTRGGIENVSFNIMPNTTTIITGRVGSGKTTLLRALTGLVESQHGKIYWNDQLVKKPDEFFVSPRVAYSPQIPHFFSDTVEENILLGKEKKEINIERAIYHAVLEKDISNLHKGIHTAVGTNGVKLSGGQQQRLSAARMFVRDADIFVFDDISSALDVDTEKILWERLEERENTTCIAVSNSKRALKKADHIILLKDGKVEAQGKLKELMEKSNEMKLIWGDE